MPNWYKSKTEFQCCMWTKYAEKVTAIQAIYINVSIAEEANTSTSTRTGTSLKILTSLSKPLVNPSLNLSCYTCRVAMDFHSPRHKLRCTLPLHIPFQKLQGFCYANPMNIVHLSTTIVLQWPNSVLSEHNFFPRYWVPSPYCELGPTDWMT